MDKNTKGDGTLATDPQTQDCKTPLDKETPNEEKIESLSIDGELEQDSIFIREQIQQIIREKTQLEKRTDLLEQKIVSFKEEKKKLIDENLKLELENERYIIQLEDLIPLSTELKWKNEKLNKIIAEMKEKEDDELTKLEKTIKTNFYDVGKALKIIKDKKLYLKTNESFKLYYQKTFNFSKTKSDHLISAATIMDNFVSHNKSIEDPEQRINILPNAESQIRSLKSFSPSEQINLWKRSIQLSQGKVPTAKIVNTVVNFFKRKDKISNTEDKNQLPKIEFVPVNKPFIGQQIRVREVDNLFPGIEGIITQIIDRGRAIVKLEGRENRELINIENLERETIIFPPKENKSYPRFDGINYRQGYGSQWYVRLGRKNYERLQKYSEEIGKTINGIISSWLDIEKAQRFVL